MSELPGISSRPIVPLAPQPLPVAAEAPPAVAPGDRLGTSTQAEELHVRRRVDEITAAVPGASAEQLKGFVDQLMTMTKKPLSEATRAQVELGLSACQGQLASLGVDRMSRGQAAFGHLKTAFGLASTDPAIATSYARTLQAFTQQSGIARVFIQRGLGIDIKQESRRVMPQLAPRTGDAMAMVLLDRLATFTGDSARRDQAKTALQELRQTHPGAEARALKELGADEARAPEDAKK